MSCPDSNAPIDININNIAGKCDLKCSYSFKYPSSSCVATNRGDYISIAYDSPSSAPVKYNDIDYYVSDVRIYTQSLHSYSGSKVDGEMIIVHNSSSGSRPLLVCVPMLNSLSGTNSSASSMVSEIVSTMSTSAPTDGESANINLDDFNLDAFVPKKTYFTYTGNEPYQPCTTEVDYVVYIPSSGPIGITEDTLSLLQTFITINQYVIVTGPKLFYNDKGSNSGTAGVVDDIYIDCKPVGVSSDEIDVVTGATPSTSDITSAMNSIINSPYFIIVVGILLVIFLLYGVNTLIGSQRKSIIADVGSGAAAAVKGGGKI
jgi:carbonic anhydrase